jgi:hypothetical protein
MGNKEIFIPYMSTSTLTIIAKTSDLVALLFSFCSHLFWIGDLNYRIGLNDFEVKEKIKKKEWQSLFQADQVLY